MKIKSYLLGIVLLLELTIGNFVFAEDGTRKTVEVLLKVDRRDRIAI